MIRLGCFSPSVPRLYHAAGNMTGDDTYTYAYNAESEIKSAAGVNYVYDAEGNRVAKLNSTQYIYGPSGEILTETNSSGTFTNEYVFFGGRRIAMRNISSGNIYYYEEDMLGSSRTMVQAGQTSVCFDADFLPFGYEKDVTTTCTQNYKFEGKERDTETANDDFGARYYTFRLGRWLSADWSSVPAPVPYANLTNPQTLNLYAMVSDNPESFADLDGHCTIDVDCISTIWGFRGPKKPTQGESARTTSGPTCANGPCKPVATGAAVSEDQATGNQQQQKAANDHPVHEVAVANETTHDNDGNVMHADVFYAKAQNTSGKGQLGGEVGAGGANITISNDTGKTNGKDNLQYFTGDASGSIGKKGAEVGANARVFEGSGQLSTSAFGYTVSVKGTFSAVGVGASAHINWSKGLDVGGGAIVGLLGAGLSVSVKSSAPPNP